MDKKNQLSNVAFGGNWSEQLLIEHELGENLTVIESAISECTERDVEDEALLNAMLYVRKNIEKGPMLCEAFFKAIRIENPSLRQQELERVGRMIWDWSGV